jgi:subtilase family protein
MPNLPHLILTRAEFDLPRKKTGFGRTPDRKHGPHGQALGIELDDVMGRFRSRRRPAGIDPSLILRVQLNPQAGVDEDAWERCGLTLLSIDENKTLVLFSSDADLSEFRSRLNQYQQGPPPGQKGAPHQQIFAIVDHIGDVRPEDRIGRLLRTEGVTETAGFVDGQEYVVDVELWDLGSRDANRAKVDELRRFVEQHQGRVTDNHVGESLVLLRARCGGNVVRELLGIEYVATVDLPPRPTLSVREILNVGLEDLPEVPAPEDGAPGVAVLDSGLTAAHPLIGPALGEATTVPRALGDASDVHGHGTMVAGIAVYGDVAECIRARSFVPRLTLYSARVLNNDLHFDDESLITTQMRESVQYFRETYGCRVFNASLGDPRLPYQGGKVSPWASILDTLARDLDVVIVVSAGNYYYDPGDGNSADAHVQNYPRYLLDYPARIIEPATGSIVLTVGALAHAAAVPPGVAGDSVAFRPVAQVEQPSPFTRCGPGLGGAIKPELCEFGGNRAYDGLMRRLVPDVRELEIVSMNREYVQRLFTTAIGTSFAAPRVAHVAARLYQAFPNASANLIRALLVSSARIPEGATCLLEPLGADANFRLCGYGRPDFQAAQTSDEARVVLYAESTLAFDNFHIYEVPIPDELIDENGTRTITVSLAYDPPVRHTRFDYLGVKMSFRLIRGKSANEVAEFFRQRNKDEDPAETLPDRNNCRLKPGPNTREGGTLQRATFAMKRRPNPDYGDTYHVVVRCERKWARDEHAPQKYAVVVTVEHSAGVNLYNTIQARVQDHARIRARQRARG